MPPVPTTQEMDKTVAFLEALEHAGDLGRGTPEAPLFPVRVQILGHDGNIYAITGRVEKAVRAYLRTTTIPREQQQKLFAGVRRELWSSHSYSEALERVRCLVEAY